MVPALFGKLSVTVSLITVVLNVRSQIIIQPELIVTGYQSFTFHPGRGNVPSDSTHTSQKSLDSAPVCIPVYLQKKKTEFTERRLNSAFKRKLHSPPFHENGKENQDKRQDTSWIFSYRHVRLWQNLEEQEKM